MKRSAKIFLATALLFALSVATVAAGEKPEKTDGFVCPVLGGEAGQEQGNSAPEPFVSISGGDITVIGPDVSVPEHATNDNGAGSPGSDHASPGDKDYTAIWSK